MTKLFFLLSVFYFQNDFETGVALFKQNKYDEAIVYFEKVLKKRA